MGTDAHLNICITKLDEVFCIEAKFPCSLRVCSSKRDDIGKLPIMDHRNQFKNENVHFGLGTKNSLDLSVRR